MLRTWREPVVVQETKTLEFRKAIAAIGFDVGSAGRTVAPLFMMKPWKDVGVQLLPVAEDEVEVQDVAKGVDAENHVPDRLLLLPDPLPHLPMERTRLQVSFDREM